MTSVERELYLTCIEDPSGLVGEITKRIIVFTVSSILIEVAVVKGLWILVGLGAIIVISSIVGMVRLILILGHKEGIWNE